MSHDDIHIWERWDGMLRDRFDPIGYRMRFVESAISSVMRKRPVVKRWQVRYGQA